jgi:hypothetical protein
MRRRVCASGAQSGGNFQWQASSNSVQWRRPRQQQLGLERATSHKGQGPAFLHTLLFIALSSTMPAKPTYSTHHGFVLHAKLYLSMCTMYAHGRTESFKGFQLGGLGCSSWLSNARLLLGAPPSRRACFAPGSPFSATVHCGQTISGSATSGAGLNLLIGTLPAPGGRTSHATSARSMSSRHMQYYLSPHDSKHDEHLDGSPPA